MTAARALALAAVFAGLAACTEFAPFETYAPPPRKGQVEAGPRVAVCYDALANSAAAVRAMALTQCPKGAALTPVGSDLTMQDCPLLLPSRAIFVCTAKK